VRVRTHLNLRLHDFPGEIKAQQRIVSIVRDETLKLRKSSRKDLGVIVICMFDAGEAHEGIRPETNEYYNAELFRELRRLVAHSEVELAKLLLVYNKADLLRRHLPPAATDFDLLDVCRRGFADTCGLLRGIVNGERIFDLLTVLERGESGYKSEGATRVKGEAARPMVEAFLGPAAAAQLDTAPPADVNF
jgi:hypothetical protein